MGRKKKIKVLYLETQLDKRIDSKRSQIGFMKQLIPILADERVEIITKEVHSKADLEKFLGYARRDPDIQYIHFGGHGQSRRGTCSIYLTGNEEINLNYKRNLGIFKNLREKIIFFSCCQIGSNSEAIKNLLKVSKSWAILGYSRDVHDHQTIIIESLFYHYCFASAARLCFKTIYEKIKFAIDYLNIDENEEPLFDPLFVGYFE